SRILDNYEIDATSGVHWTSDTTYDAVVPAGYRWLLIGGHINRTVSGTMSAAVYNAADKLVLFLAYASAATGKTGFPNTVESGSSLAPPVMIPMDPGWYVRVTLGASQDASAEGSCVVLEVKL
ncbi:unnamed protein product, partial [marine sediment metagenome]